MARGQHHTPHGERSTYVQNGGIPKAGKPYSQPHVPKHHSVVKGILRTILKLK